MPPSVDEVQQVRDSLVEALDTYAPIVALTGRASRNVVPMDETSTVRTSDKKPVIGYELLPSTRGGGEIGIWYTHQIQFEAEASTARVANELLHHVKEGLNALRLSQLATYPLDASLRKDQELRLPTPEPDLPDAERVGLQLTLVVKHA